MPDPRPAESVAEQVRQLLLGLADRPVEEHAGVLTEVHRVLQDALATVDQV